MGRDYSNWIKSRIEDYGFIEGQDYLLDKFIKRATTRSVAGHNKKDYYLTIDTAKEIAMYRRILARYFGDRTPKSMPLKLRILCSPQLGTNQSKNPT